MLNKLKLQQTIHNAILESLGSDLEKRRKELEFELMHLSRKFVLQVEDYLEEEDYLIRKGNDNGQPNKEI